jgi:hypothetical protein
MLIYHGRSSHRTYCTPYVMLSSYHIIKCTHLVGHCIYAGSCVVDGEFRSLPISLSDHVQIFLIIFISLTTHTHKRLTATHNDHLVFWMNPR